MIIYRLSRIKYADTLSGFGAALSGGRWNSKGTEMIYAAENRTLAMSEVFVHLPVQIIPVDYMILSIHVPESIDYGILRIDELPSDWANYPPTSSTQIIGDNFIRKNKLAVLRVPSVITKDEFNFLINPYHQDFHQIKIINKEPFLFNSRLFKS